MTNNVQKLPLASLLNRHTIREAENRVRRVGQCLPCSVVAVVGSIVTVKFEVQDAKMTLPHATMPVFGPEYIRWPIQVGDKGMAVPADAYMGQMSGLGDGVAELRQLPNLATHTFMPVGNAKWEPVDGNAVVIYGPNGVVARATTGTATITLLPDQITMQVGSVSLTITSDNIKIDGFLYASNDIQAGSTTSGAPGSTRLMHHDHMGGSLGSGFSGPPVPGT